MSKNLISQISFDIFADSKEKMTKKRATVYIYCDGGCNNISMDKAYGSVAVFYDGDAPLITRYHYPDAHTSNEAEYLTLLKAFEFATDDDVQYIVHTDSQLLVGQLTEGWKIKAINLKPFVTAGRKFLLEHPNVKIEKVDRKLIVDVLGH